MAEKEQPKLKVNEELIRDFVNGRLQAAVERKLVAHLDARPDLMERLSSSIGPSFSERLRIVRSGSSAESSDSPKQTSKPPSKDTGSPSSRSNIPAALTSYPGYEIIRELGRGGMGVVYLAKNIAMDRLEVLKVLNERLLEHPGAKERFLREIRAISKLNHPNIVTSYSVLPIESLLVFVMEYVPGIDLLGFIKNNHPLPIALCCTITQQLAAGLQHAHLKGLVHRDIKPSNAMVYQLDGEQQLKILDFGLAKATSEGAATGLTVDGMLLGTPEYMAPEQILDAATADIRADIYSLGCTLYHMISGKPPFSGTQGAIILAHSQSAAKPINTLRPEVPLGLTQVIEKMLAKDKNQRFQTPSEVVQALVPFIALVQGGNEKRTSDSQAASLTSLEIASAARDTSLGLASVELAVDPTDEKPSAKPVKAAPIVIAKPLDRPTTPLPTNPSRHERRNLLPQLPTAWRKPLMVAASVVTLIAGLWLLSGLLYESLIGEPEYESDSPIVSKPSEANSGLAQDSPDTSLDKSQPSSPAPQAQDTITAEEIAELRSPAAGQQRARMVRDSRLKDNTEVGRQLVNQLRSQRWPIDLLDASTISAYEKRVAGGSNANLEKDGLVAVIGNSRWKMQDGANCMDSSRDDSIVAVGVGNGQVVLYDPKNGEVVSQFTVSNELLLHLDLNAQGTKLLTCGADRLAKLWDVKTQQLLQTFAGHDASVYAATFSRDESSVFTFDHYNQMRIWDPTTGQVIKTFSLPERPQEATVHPTRDLVAVAGLNGQVMIVDVSAMKVIDILSLDSSRVSSVDYSPDGRFLAASQDNGTVTLWRVEPNHRYWRKHTFQEPPANAVHFSHDSNTLAVGTRFYFWLWNHIDDQRTYHHEGHATVLDVEPVGDKWLAAWNSCWISLADDKGKLLNADASVTTAAAMSLDGSSIATSAREAGQVHVWNLDNPPTIRVLRGQTDLDDAIAFAPDGATIYSGGGDWTVKTWNPQTGRTSKTYVQQLSRILSIDANSIGNRICSAGEDKALRIFDITSSEALHTLRGHTDTIASARFNPDGSKIITASYDGTAKIWNADEGRIEKTVDRIKGERLAAAFRPFSKDYAVTDVNAVQLYSLQNETRVRSFVGHSRQVLDLDFSPNGEWLVTGSFDGTVKVWDVETTNVLKTFRIFPGTGYIHTARFTPDGRHIFTRNGNGTIYIFRMESFSESSLK